MTRSAKSPPHLAQGGLGVGLSVVRGLIALHDGAVSVSSPSVGQGSTFSIRLALAAPPTEQAVLREPAVEEPSSQRANGSPGLRVLVVDDNQDAADERL